MQNFVADFKNGLQRECILLGVLGDNLLDPIGAETKFDNLLRNFWIVWISLIKMIDDLLKKQLVFTKLDVVAVEAWNHFC